MKNESSLPPFKPGDIAELRRKNRLARNTMLFYFVAGLVVAFVTPENMLQYPWARGFVDFMSFIPYVAKVGLASFAHPIAPFFAAVMCVLSWVILPRMWGSAYPFPQEITQNSVRVRQILKYGGAVLFLVMLVMWAIISPSFDSGLGRLQISSRVGMGMCATIVLGGMPFISMVVAIFIRNWRYVVYGDMEKLYKRNSRFY